MIGQSLEVTPDSVIGVLGESVDITWTVTKIDQDDVVSDTRLYFGTKFTKDNLLYQGVAKLTQLKPAGDKFGGRIHATFKEPKFTLTLNNLSFNDTITFTLVVNQENGATLTPRPVNFKSVKILAIKGVYLCVYT